MPCSSAPRASSSARASSRARTRRDGEGHRPGDDPLRQPQIIAEVSKGLGSPMRGIELGEPSRRSAWRFAAGRRRRGGAPGPQRPPRIGVLAVQGAFRSTSTCSRELGAEPVEVRLPRDLVGLAALILPGGESTTMRKLIDALGLREPILPGRAGAPMLGTCAGMILLAERDHDGDPPVFRCSTSRCAQRLRPPARQLRGRARRAPAGRRAVHGVFIRAPIVERVGPRRRRPGRARRRPVVAVRQGACWRPPSIPSLPVSRASTGWWRRWPPHAEPGEGSGRRRIRCGGGRRGTLMTRVASRGLAAAGSFGALTDLAAVGELSRLSHEPEVAATAQPRALARPAGQQQPHRRVQPVPPAAGRLPAARPLYVYEDAAASPAWPASSARRRATSGRSSSSTHSTTGEAGDIRFRLVQHLLRDGSEARCVRFHVACADEAATSSCSCRPASRATARRRILYRPPDQPLPRPLAGRRAAPPGHPAVRAARRPAPRPAVPRATPAPVSRLEAYRLHDWERQGSHWRVPRSALTPILRFADIEVHLRGPGRTRRALAFVQVGVAKEEQPHYLRVIGRPGPRPQRADRYGMGIIGERIGAGQPTEWAARRQERGIVSAVRTDDLDALLEALPPEICDRLRGAAANRTDLIEVVMDLGRRPEARFTGGEEDLLEREITEEDIQYVIDHIGSFGDDNRAGIERTLHRISAIRNRAARSSGLTAASAARSSARSRSSRHRRVGQSSSSWAARASARRRCCARRRACWPTSSTSASSWSTRQQRDRRRRRHPAPGHRPRAADAGAHARPSSTR
jgi:pyridoxal 5'-phosphate synthase glutaminase subunit Pdx2